MTFSPKHHGDDTAEKEKKQKKRSFALAANKGSRI
ncbi:hypothetical protein VTH82DRAFT_2049 [Thermothelomyces myriococcoides]